ncbi:DNA-directed RNA polymerase subunit beta [Homoserinibacter sp. GY 40078]|uniref:DNA-directed RNA polymerase subunit beta n=1 Tax=Homoserinibacter sp. GY 40078 TaxID=2603275 RepID=UPI0011C737B0|nr:DNA-directed RNA polymerase subunit beta [Homoserinibacter sp. GY 40078]TXK19324.1 DNA-directed RNA polymerase subunit beta [Homoserinibacter sp. GY 40078]
MADDFRKPVLFGGREFEAFAGSRDPAATLRIAHDTARALLTRVRDSDDPSVLDRAVRFVDENGIDALAELWAVAGPHTLPGAMWRIYLLHAMIRQDPEGTAQLFQRGTEVLPTIDPVVAGAPAPAGPQEVLELADRILRGAFDGELAYALERAAAFCRVEAAGALSVADDQDAAAPERSKRLTTQASRLASTAEELSACAGLARDGALD